jgi:predicted  nucleic acid-binding Zn-ribbon protein
MSKEDIETIGRNVELLVNERRRLDDAIATIQKRQQTISELHGIILRLAADQERQVADVEKRLAAALSALEQQDAKLRALKAACS